MLCIREDGGEADDATMSAQELRPMMFRKEIHGEFSGAKKATTKSHRLFKGPRADKGWWNVAWNGRLGTWNSLDGMDVCCEGELF